MWLIFAAYCIFFFQGTVRRWEVFGNCYHPASRPDVSCGLSTLTSSMPASQEMLTSYISLLTAPFRMLQFGRLVPRSRDLQRTSTSANRLSFAAFVVAVPALHWVAVLRYWARGMI